VGVAAVFDRQVMEAKLLRESLKVLTGRIADIGPQNVSLYDAQFADISNYTVFIKLSGLGVQADCFDQRRRSPMSGRKTS
jgi:hypothetical protein